MHNIGWCKILQTNQQFERYIQEFTVVSLKMFCHRLYRQYLGMDQLLKILF